MAILLQLSSQSGTPRSSSPLRALLPGYRYFECSVCKLPRASSTRILDQDYCRFCAEGLTDDSEDIEQQTKWCIQGNYDIDRTRFIYDDREYTACNPCRLQAGRGSLLLTLAILPAPSPAPSCQARQCRFSSLEAAFHVTNPPLKPNNPKFLSNPALID